MEIGSWRWMLWPGNWGDGEEAVVMMWILGWGLRSVIDLEFVVSVFQPHVTLLGVRRWLRAVSGDRRATSELDLISQTCKGYFRKNSR